MGIDNAEFEREFEKVVPSLRTGDPGRDALPSRGYDLLASIRLAHRRALCFRMEKFAPYAPSSRTILAQ